MERAPRYSRLKLTFLSKITKNDRVHGLSVKRIFIKNHQHKFFLLKYDVILL